MSEHEIWKPVPGWKYYEVSNLGQVRSLTRDIGNRTFKGKILKPNTHTSGNYPRVCLYQDGHHKYYFVATLVAMTFISPRPEGMEVCHNDGNPSNSAASNLRWDTHVNNERDKIAHGTNLHKKCRNGHLYTEDNTYLLTRGDGRKERRCKRCLRKQERLAREKRVSNRLHRERLTDEPEVHYDDAIRQ